MLDASAASAAPPPVPTTTTTSTPGTTARAATALMRTAPAAAARTAATPAAAATGTAAAATRPPSSPQRIPRPAPPPCSARPTKRAHGPALPLQQACPPGGLGTLLCTPQCAHGCLQGGVGAFVARRARSPARMAPACRHHNAACGPLGRSDQPCNPYLCERPLKRAPHSLCTTSSHHQVALPARVLQQHACRCAASPDAPPGRALPAGGHCQGAVCDQGWGSGFRCSGLRCFVQGVSA